MKKRKKLFIILGIISIIVLIITVLSIPNPKRILVKYASTLDVDLNPILPSIKITHFEEQWYPNGDGDMTICFNYIADEDFFQGFDKLPMEDTKCLACFLKLKQGYYKLEETPDFQKYLVLIFNTDSQTGVLYLSIA